MLPIPGDAVCAGLDLGFRSDSSALVIVHQRDQLLLTAEVVELRPSAGRPLKPSYVCRTFIERMRAHGCTYAVGDSHYREAIVEHLSDANLAFADAPNPPSLAYVRARELLREGRVRIPRHPRLIQQLREVEGRANPGGGMSIVQPRWKTGGHGDLVSAWVLALYQFVGETVQAPVKPGWDEEVERQKRRDAAREKTERPYWQGGTAKRFGTGLSGLDARVARAESRFRRR